MNRACLPCLLTLAAVAPALAADWPMDRHDARRTASSPEDLPRDLALLWTLSLPKTVPAWPEQPRLQFDAAYRPIVVGRHLVVASPNDDSVAAYDAATGAERWRFVSGGPFRLPPAAADGRVFAGSDDGWLYALDAERGTLLWKRKGAPRTRRVLGNGRLIDTWPVRGGPVVADGTVYYAAGIWPFMGVFVEAVDAATGRVDWSSSGDGAAWLKQPHGAPSFAGPAPQGALAVDGDLLVVPCGHAVPALYDRRTGALRSFLLEQRLGGHEAAIVDGRTVVNGAAALDAGTGKAVALVPGLAAIDGRAGYGIAADRVSAFDLGELNPVAVKPGPPEKGKAAPPKRSSRGAPPSTGFARFAGARTAIRAGGRLYVGGPGRVAAYALPLPNSALPAWEARVDGSVAVLLAGAGRLFAVTEEGAVHCFGAPGSPPPAPAAEEEPGDAPEARAIARAGAVLDDAGADSGFALVAGPRCGELARALARLGRLHVVACEEDPAQAEALRRALRRDGLLGSRAAFVEAGLARAALPPFLFRVAVLTAPPADGPPAAWLETLFESLHPYAGAAYLPADPRLREALEAFAAARGDGSAEVDAAAGGLLRLARRNGLPGAGAWTHEHADAANTRCSRDALAKAPLGLLWFGGVSHEGILPRHGHGPQPQALDGRLVIEGVDLLRAIDCYDGRLLWEASLPGVGSAYDNTLHQPGANATGGNFVMAPDGVYVTLGRSCLRLDPATGETAGERRIPEEAASTANPSAVWGYLGVDGDVLVGGVAVPTPASTASEEKFVFEEDDDVPGPVVTAGGLRLPRTLSSRHLFALDRESGRLLWTATAEREFRHNAICLGGGRLYAIDRELPQPRPARPAAKRPGEAPKPPAAALKAFDLRTGRLLWRRDGDVYGTWLSWSAAHDLLVESGREARDTLSDEPRGMRAFRAADGAILWKDGGATGPAMLRGDWVVTSRGALELATGKPVKVPDPLTGRPVEWRWARMYGCNTPTVGENLMTFRSGAAGFYDFARLGGTGNIGGARSGCSNNLVVAGGLLVAPEYTRTCTCSYPIQSSYALRPDPDAELWTFQATTADVKDPVRRVGINLGAPGDRVSDAGTLWLEHPDSNAPSPRLRVMTEPARLETFRRHASTVDGPMPWVTASGCRGLRSLTVVLNGKAEQPKPFTIRLWFTEPDGLAAGARAFDVYLQGHKVAEGLDIAAEAGGPARSLVRELRGILAGTALTVGLRPVRGETVLCGVEVVREGE